METTNQLPPTGMPTWAPLKKTAFRFFFIFIGLNTWFGYNVVSSVLNVDSGKWGTWMSIFSKPLYWLDKHFYHIGFKPMEEKQFIGIIDWQVGWALMVTFIWVALVGCVIWGIADRKRKNYEKLDYWFRTYLAYYLYLAMVVYAVDKIVFVQMPFPNAASLLQPLGDKSRFLLLWNFVGVSPGYSIFTGICELVAALLVLCRRTRVFGCLFMATVMANVVCFNVFYNIVVKLLSMQLLLITLYMLVPYVSKLFKFFYLLQPVSLSEKQYTFTTRWKKYVMVALLLVPAWATYNAFVFFIEKGKKDIARQQQKVYDVTSFIKGSDTMPPLLTDTFRLKRIAFTAYRGEKFAIAYSMKDEPVNYDYKWDSATKSITFIDGDDTTKKYPLHYTELPKKQLTLTGQWKGQNVRIMLTKFEIDSMPIVTEKIKWVQGN